MSDNGNPQLDERIDYNTMGLEWCQGCVMPHRYYPGVDNCNRCNSLCDILSSVTPADLEIPVPPQSPDKSVILPLQTPLSKGL